jgi:hypothetical protein
MLSSAPCLARYSLPFRRGEEADVEVVWLITLRYPYREHPLDRPDSLSAFAQAVAEYKQAP